MSRKLSTDLFEQISPLRGRERLDQLLLGRRQNALETDYEEITDQMGVEILRPSPHVILFEAAHTLANGSFDFSLCFNGDLQRWAPERE